jgi:5'-nucleotidase
LKILVTNDDGFHAPGLWAAVEALKDAGQVFVVAPDRDQSGVGGSLSLRRPLRAHEMAPLVSGGQDKIVAYSVEGTPADSSVLALESLVGPVDLVVSGINQGSNLGEDVLISGTVGAAFQGYVRGYPAVAISVGAITDTRFEVASAFLHLLGIGLAQGSPLPATLMNVNIPNEPIEAIEGVQVTRLGRRSYSESVTSEQDGKHTYYKINRGTAVYQQEEQAEGTDTWALLHKNISVTPLYTALTDMERMPAVEEIFQGYSHKLLGR